MNIPMAVDDGSPLFALFLEACKIVPTMASQRQWNKFQRRDGSAWRVLSCKAKTHPTLRTRLWDATGKQLE